MMRNAMLYMGLWGCGTEAQQDTASSAVDKGWEPIEEERAPSERDATEVPDELDDLDSYCATELEALSVGDVLSEECIGWFAPSDEGPYDAPRSIDAVGGYTGSAAPAPPGGQGGGLDGSEWLITEQALGCPFDANGDPLVKQPSSYTGGDGLWISVYSPVTVPSRGASAVPVVWWMGTWRPDQGLARTVMAHTSIYDLSSFPAGATLWACHAYPRNVPDNATGTTALTRILAMSQSGSAGSLFPAQLVDTYHVNP